MSSDNIIKPTSILERTEGSSVRSACGKRALSKPTLVALGLLLPATLVALWFWVTGSELVPPYQLPSPAAVWDAAIDLNNRGVLGLYVGISTQRVLIGFAIGSGIGLAVGSLTGLSRAGAAFLSPLLGALRTVPSLAWVPLLILWLKIGETSKITLIAIGAFFPVYTTVASALQHVDPRLLEAGRSFGLRGIRLLRVVQLPAVLPQILAGLRLALAQSWLFLVAAELIASSMGLGFLLMESGSNGRVDRIILAILLLALLGKITDSVVGLAEKQLLKRWS